MLCQKLFTSLPFHSPDNVLLTMQILFISLKVNCVV